jgi:hypothetical protein
VAYAHAILHISRIRVKGAVSIEVGLQVWRFLIYLASSKRMGYVKTDGRMNMKNEIDRDLDGKVSCLY